MVKLVKVSFFKSSLILDVLTHLKYVPEGGKDYEPGLEPTTTVAKEGKTTLLLACSSDRGLCGAIHSSIAKTARRLAALDRNNTSIAVLGDKAKPQISRDSRRNIQMHFTQVGRNIPTFLDALVIWQEIRANTNLKFDQAAIIYNRFVSAISFEAVVVKPPTLSTLLASERLTAYEYDPEIMGNLVDYLTVSRLYWALVEGHAAEMSSKRTAMENATKNAEAIVVNLTMKYNRTRQAVITNELVDIITGASAL
jgi:F-type H+-transporting ATPase subunit gamma